jgi:hypothetical protein
MGSFSIANLAAPTLNALSSPQTTDRPTFTWNTVGGAANYDLWVDRLNLNGTVAQSQQVRFTVAGGATNSYTLTTAQALTPGFNYRWWVGAMSTNGQATSWSSMGTFFIAGMAAPTANAINMTSTTLGGAGTVSTTPTFSWNSSPAGSTAPAYYDIWVDELTASGSLVTTQRVRMYVSGTQTSWKVGTAGSATNPPGAAARKGDTAGFQLTSGRSYRYWIGAVSANGSEVWSGVYYFKAV